jgi:hypothetical protein
VEFSQYERKYNHAVVNKLAGNVITVLARLLFESKATIMSGEMKMKRILVVAVVLLALVGTLGYVLNHKAPVQVAATSLSQENAGGKAAAQFTHLTKAESDSLAMIEDKSLFGLNAGAFNPQFEPLSSSEQKTLQISEEQNPGLQSMTAGDITFDDHGGVIVISTSLLIIIILLIILI